MHFTAVQYDPERRARPSVGQRCSFACRRRAGARDVQPAGRILIEHPRARFARRICAIHEQRLQRRDETAVRIAQGNGARWVEIDPFPIIACARHRNERRAHEQHRHQHHKPELELSERSLAPATVRSADAHRVTHGGSSPVLKLNLRYPHLAD